MANTKEPETTQAVAKTESTAVVVATDLMSDKELTQDQIDLLKRTICKGATDDELALFIGVCKRTQLDPFARQIYAVKRWDQSQNKEVMQAQVSIDGLRLTAQRSGDYAGQEGPYWCGKDGEWKDVWLSDENPAAAKVIVYRRGFDHPITGIALWKEYVGKKKDGTITQMWKTKGSVMIAKCAEAVAERRAFPMELSGLYITEEMPFVEVEGKLANPETGEFEKDAAPENLPQAQAKVAKKTEAAKAEVKEENKPKVQILEPEDVQEAEFTEEAPAVPDDEPPFDTGNSEQVEDSSYAVEESETDEPSEPAVAPESEDDDPDKLEEARTQTLERLKKKFENAGDPSKQALAIRNFFITAHVPMGNGTSVKQIIWSFNLARIGAINAYLDSLDKSSGGS